MTVRLDRAAVRVVDPDAGAVLGPAETAALADRLAGTLRARGLGPGEVVAWQLPNWWETVVLYLACWRAQLVPLPLHHRLGDRDAEGLADRAGARLLLRAAELRAGRDLDAALAATPLRAAGGQLEAAARGAGRSAAVEPRRAGPDDLLGVVLATSGSTGPPKLVLHRRAALEAKAAQMVAAHGLTAADTVLMPAPMAHISGLLNGVLLPAACGMTVVVQPRWDPARAAALIREHRVTFMIGPPTFFVDLMAATRGPEEVGPLRLVSCGGAGVTPAFVEEARTRLGATVKRTYGSTEAPTVTTSHVGDPPQRMRDTDGRPVGATELRIVDPADRTVRPAGEVGMLEVRAPELFVGYDDPARTAEVVDAEGWFRTGDLAWVDPEGWLTVVGRADDTIIRGGENISPARIEAVLARIPGVVDAVVVGVPDVRLGQRVAAAVVADREVTVEEVAAACRAAGLARFEVPELVRRLEALPRMASGKVDRAAVRRLLTP